MLTTSAGCADLDARSTGQMQLTTKSYSSAFILAAALAAVAWLVNRIGGGDPTGAKLGESPVAYSASQPMRDGETHRPSIAAASASSQSKPSLPPENVPLRSIIDQLATRAQTGDRLAACRLAFELGRCRASAIAEEAAAASLQRIKSIPFDPQTRAEVEKQLRDSVSVAAPYSSLCQDVTGQDLDSAFRQLRTAVAMDDTTSMVRFVTAPPLAARGSGKDSEAWAIYAATAPGILQRAVDLGDPRAIQFAHGVATGLPTPGGVRLALQDPDRALELGYALQMVATGADAIRLNRRISRLEAKVGPHRAGAAASAAQLTYSSKLLAYVAAYGREVSLDDSASNCR